MSGSDLVKGITPAGSGKAGQPSEVVWSILGHTYWLKAESKDCFIFETLDPPGTFVPPHIHPTQDEYIYRSEGTFDLYLDGAWTKANAGDLVRMPRGLPHAYYNRQDKPARALFSVRLARRWASCSTSCTISPIRLKSCAARRSAKLTFCHPGRCRGHSAARLSRTVAQI